MEQKELRRKAFLAGAKDTIPLMIGAAPFGLIFGALGVSGGLSAAATQGMSLFVFAGSSQFIAAGLVAEGTPVLMIIITTFVVNLRHALYSASLAPYLKHLPQRWLIPMSFGLTDETYAVVISRYQKDEFSEHREWFYMGSMLSMYTNWQIWTLLGILLGQSISGIENWGLDFAMAATFIGIVVTMIESWPMLASALSAGITAILTNNMPNKLGLMVAALVGIAVGLGLEAAGVGDFTRKEAAHE